MASGSAIAYPTRRPARLEIFENVRSAITRRPCRR